jgi:hypothetical protein
MTPWRSIRCDRLSGGREHVGLGGVVDMLARSETP